MRLPRSRRQRSQGCPGVCLTTLGPGAASVVNGVACAYLDRAPLIVFTDNHATRAGGAFEHQWLDQRALFAPVTKWSGVPSPDSATETIDRAIAIALTPPRDRFTSNAQVTSHPLSYPIVPRPSRLVPRPNGPGPQTRVIVDALLARSTRPLMLVGLGARRAEDVRVIRDFCAAARAAGDGHLQSEGRRSRR